MKKEIIGILGGSFDKAHAGHLFISKHAKQQLGLDKVWWMVSHHHPFKPKQTAFEERYQQACALPKPPWIKVSDFEREHQTTSSYETLSLLRARLPHKRFVFLMGADAFCSLHLWHNYRELIELMPLAVLPRAPFAARSAKSAARYQAARVPQHKLRTLPFLPAPALAFIPAPLHPLSSTALRQKDN